MAVIRGRRNGVARPGSCEAKITERYPEMTTHRAYWCRVTLGFVRPGKPTDKGLIEASNGRLWAECPQ